MDADQMRKNDEHPEGKGGETKLLRRRMQGTQTLFDFIRRSELTAWRIFYLSRRNADEVSMESTFLTRGPNAVF